MNFFSEKGPLGGFSGKPKAPEDDVEALGAEGDPEHEARVAKFLEEHDEGEMREAA